MSRSREMLSIGEVLKELEKDFPEVTISKIRFLESEGLIDPQRTPSGYRKFSRNDISRLRYILQLQKDQFLPLKVIRSRLEHYDPATDGAETMSGTIAPSPASAAGLPPSASTVPGQSSVAPPTPAPPREDDEPLILEGGLQLSFQQLVSVGGLEEDRVRELEEYGLVDAHETADGEIYYDEDDLLVVKAARDYAKFGIEPRHLRMYRNFAEKEAGLFEHILIPMSKSGADSRRQTMASLKELARLSRRMKDVQLRLHMRKFLSG